MNLDILMTPPKNINNKSKEGKFTKRRFTTINDEVWFPEQLAKVNVLLGRAILFPHEGKGKK